MALVGAPGSNRLAAVLILVIVLLLVYLVGFHWFILRHLEYGEEAAGLSEQLGRYQQVAGQRGQYESLLQELRERRSEEDLFLDGSDFNEAAAGLSERLSQMIGLQAEDNCQIVSRQPVRPRVEERFERVTVNVRMRCGIDDLGKLLYALETGVPMVIMEEVTVIKPRSRSRRRRDQEPEAGTLLDIRFNMSGYLRTPG